MDDADEGAKWYGMKSRALGATLSRISQDGDLETHINASVLLLVL